jgi:hypothetical protein
MIDKLYEQKMLMSKLINFFNRPISGYRHALNIKRVLLFSFEIIVTK